MFNNKTFENQTFKKALCTTENVEKKVFNHCIFDSCDFTQSNFANSHFIDCIFQNCNLSLIKLEKTRLQNAYFESCKCVGVSFAECDPFFLTLSFRKCRIESCNFSGLPLKKALFIECAIRETHFIETQLEEVNFSQSDLSGTLFHHANLQKANFTEAVNYSINPLTNKILKARFSKSEVLSLLNYFDIVID